MCKNILVLIKDIVDKTDLTWMSEMESKVENMINKVSEYLFQNRCLHGYLPFRLTDIHII